MIDYTKHFSSLKTVQTQPIPGQQQIKNEAGGYAYETSIWNKFRRFLILGTEGGTFYMEEKKLSIQNANSVLECIEQDYKKALALIVEISDEGKALQNEQAIFALLLALSHKEKATRREAKAAFNKIVRTATHLFQFMSMAKNMRGWGRLLRETVAGWYLDKDIEDIAYQVLKYQQREGYSHRDVLRLAHVKPKTDIMSNLFAYAVKKDYDFDKLPTRVQAVVKLHEETDIKNQTRFIYENGLTHEMIPNEIKSDPKVWLALLNKMPLTAILRNLNKMTSIGLLTEESEATDIVVQIILDKDYIKKSRLHPLTILMACKQYAIGHGDKGSLFWKPVKRIEIALNSAFYLSFGNAEPVNKNICLAIDVSGSMTWHVHPKLKMTPREISAVMALVTANVEKSYEILGFSHKLVPLNIKPAMKLPDVIKILGSVPYGATDCALPIIRAQNERKDFEMFVVYTDGQTYSGDIHPSQALKQYQRKINSNAKLCVVTMESNNTTLAEPNNPTMLDLCGCSTDMPQIISAFGRGEL